MNKYVVSSLVVCLVLCVLAPLAFSDDRVMTQEELIEDIYDYYEHAEIALANIFYDCKLYPFVGLGIGIAPEKTTITVIDYDAKKVKPSNPQTVYVVKIIFIFRHSPAFGKLRPEDIVYAVNGEKVGELDVKDLPADENESGKLIYEFLTKAQKMIADSEDDMSLAVRRGRACIEYEFRKAQIGKEIVFQLTDAHQESLMLLDRLAQLRAQKLEDMDYERLIWHWDRAMELAVRTGRIAVEVDKLIDRQKIENKNYIEDLEEKIREDAGR